MKKKYFLFLISCFLFISFRAQNLVLNPSFEDTVVCPSTTAQVYNCQFWKSPTLGTPEYYNSCSNPSGIGVPRNLLGFQYARTGNGYLGAFGYEIGGPDVREYVQGQLSLPLIAGKKYSMSFYVVLCNDTCCGTYSINSMGMFLSSTAVFGINQFNLPYTPQVQNNKSNFLNDTLNWTKISGSFVAQGGEKYITIGNFNNDANTDTLRVYSDKYGVAYGAYYYIDDVSVTEIPENSVYLPNVFSPNGDGKNDMFFVQGNNIKDIILIIYNRWGEKIFESQNINRGWNGTYQNEICNTDVFYYYLTGTYTDDSPFAQKGNVTLVR